jgi:hypothetical protein
MILSGKCPLQCHIWLEDTTVSVVGSWDGAPLTFGVQVSLELPALRAPHGWGGRAAATVLLVWWGHICREPQRPAGPPMGFSVHTMGQDLFHVGGSAG